MSEKWYGVGRIVLWLAVGIAIGGVTGLVVGWVIWPIEFTEADPTVLEESYQRDYTVMIAAAYDLDGDLISARRRLASLGQDDADEWLLGVTVDYILEERDEDEIRQLVQLANDLGLESPLMAPYVEDGGAETAGSAEQEGQP